MADNEYTDPEVPEADAAEQRQPVIPEETDGIDGIDGQETVIPAEADVADAVEQQQSVPLGDDDYR
jgi:hypothetical protein